MALSTGVLDLLVALSVTEKSTGFGAGARTKEFTHRVDVRDRWGNGVGSGKQDVVWSDRRSISAADDLDLRGGLVSELDGSAIVFPLVTALLIRNLGVAGGGYLTIGGGSNPFVSWLAASGDALIVPAGGMLLLANPIGGYATVAGTGDILRVTPSTGTIEYDIAIVGRQS